MPRTGVLVIAIIVVMMASPFVSGASSYEISTGGSVSTPPRDVTVEQETYTVTSVTAVPEGDSFSASVSAPDTTYDLYLYNSEKQIVKNKRMSGSDSATFATSDLSVGSYVLAVYGPDGNFQDIQPVVIEGYQVTQSAPSTVTEGESTTVTASLDSIASNPDLSYVELVLMQDQSLVTRIEMSKSGDSYEASLPESLTAGTYSYYVAVHGTETVNDRKELIALGTSSSITVEAVETTQSSTGGSSSGSSTSTTETTTQTQTTTTPETTTVAPTSTTQSTLSTTSETSQQSATTTENVQTTERSTTGEGTVITPATTDQPVTTEETLPANGVQILAVLLLLLALAVRRT